MAVTYFPFDAGSGSAITEASWQKMARRWLNTGVITGYLNQLQVTADGTAMSVSVNTGAAWIEGFYGENDAAAAQTIAAAHATLSRIDRVVLRLDRTANTVALAVLTGTAAASPVAPTLTTTDTLWEIGLATVLVDPAVGVIAAGKVTDTRILVKNLTAAEASAAYYPISGSLAAVGCSLFRNASQSIPNNTITSVLWNAEAFDTTAFHDLATNTDRVTIPAGQAGKYLLTASAQWDHNATGRRYLALERNGTTTLAVSNFTGGAGDTAGGLQHVVLTVDTLAVGDYVRLVALQVSGGALGLGGGGNISSSSFQAIKLGT